MQRITVTCEQMYEVDDSVNASATHESSDMGLDGWRFAIEGAAAAAGFSKNMLNQMIIDWAGDIEESTGKEDLNNAPM